MWPVGSTDRGMQASERELPDAKAFVLMELLVDKLKLLNYEQSFCRSRTPLWPRLHKLYFAMPSPDRNEQFLYFASLVAWLYSLIDVPFSTPLETDDPNLICSNITSKLKDIGFAPPPWSPSKLKQGYGDAVCSVLAGLADLVLEFQDFQFSLPTYTDIGKPLVVDEIDAETADELFMFNPTKANEEPADSQEVPTKQEEHFDWSNWKLELSRVASALRFSVVSDAKEWRTHIEHAQNLHRDFSESLSANDVHLQRVEAEISSTLEKLESREKFINSQIEPLTTEYAAAKRRLSDVQQKYGNSLDNVTEFTNEIAHIAEQIEQVKQMTVDKGNMISDVSPLVQIKSAVQKLKGELSEMEVRVGVARHALLQVELRKANKGDGLAVF